MEVLGEERTDYLSSPGSEEGRGPRPGSAASADGGEMRGADAV